MLILYLFIKLIQTQEKELVMTFAIDPSKIEQGVRNNTFAYC